MTDGKIAEALVTVFLRLNGYFTTGFIIHTESNARLRGEIDCLAVRFPNRETTEFSIADCVQLNPSKEYIDLLICEVKSSNPTFNNSIQQPEGLSQALSWAGVIPSEKLDAAVGALTAMFKNDEIVKLSTEGYKFDNVRVRALLACPRCDSNNAPAGVLTGQIMMDYLYNSLHNSKRPETCGRRYDFKQWGGELTEIVKWFKKQKANACPTFKELCKALGTKA